VSQLSQSQPDEFPLEVLPERVLVFVALAADALNVDPALVAGPCLATLAGCVGNRRRIVLKPGAWYEVSVLWIATVMRSGGKKTPSNGLVLEYLYAREAVEIEEEKVRRAEYEEELQQWKSEPENKRGEPPEKPGRSDLERASPRPPSSHRSEGRRHLKRAESRCVHRWRHSA
jgi:hypothetical protein